MLSFYRQLNPDVTSARLAFYSASPFFFSHLKQLLMYHSLAIELDSSENELANISLFHYENSVSVNTSCISVSVVFDHVIVSGSSFKFQVGKSYDNKSSLSVIVADKFKMLDWLGSVQHLYKFTLIED